MKGLASVGIKRGDDVFTVHLLPGNTGGTICHKLRNIEYIIICRHS